MLKTLCRLSIALILLGLSFSPRTASAQIAPTSSATISGSVSDSAGNPVFNAKVSINGPKSASTQTDSHGLFVFVGMPFGTYQISAAAAGLGTATRNIAVESDTNIAIQYASPMNGLKVIAQVSSVSNASFNVTPASITQVNPAQSAFEGKTSWRTILEQIPGVAQAGLGTGATQYSAFPDGPFVPMQISINGALPYETATLLDDMPLIGGSVATYGVGTGTDLSAYPLNGFDGADVVRGPGAAAPSIVNSVGGSFVLHPPGVVNQNHYELSLSTDPYGGIIANAQAAVRWHKLSAIVTYGVNDSSGPTNGAQVPANTYVDPVAVNGTPFTLSTLPCSPPTCYYRYTASGSFFNPNYALNSFPFYGYLTGLLTCCSQVTTSWSQHSGSLALHYALSPSINAEVFYAGQVSQESLPSGNYLDTFEPPAGYTGSIPAGEQSLSLLGEYPISYPNQTSSSLIEEKITAQIGRGLLRIAALQNRTFSPRSYSLPGSVEQQLFGGGCVSSPGALASATCGAGYAPMVFNGGTYNVTYLPFDYVCDRASNNRDLLLNYTSPLGANLRIGASFVKSYYDEPGSTFVFLGPPDNIEEDIPTASAISQTTNELRVFMGGNPSAKTSLDLSMYFVNADYHVPNPDGGAPVLSIATVGTLTDYTCSQPSAYTDTRYTYAAPRLGFVWRPTAGVAVRASAGGGFAEAPLNDLIGSNGAPFCTDTSCSVTLTNLNLQPEKSFAFDLGTDVRMRRNTVLSFDVYRTNLYGQLYNSTTVSGSCPTCGGLPLYVTQYGNVGESRYEGILLDVRHNTPRGVYWALSGGLTRAYVINLPAGFYNTAGGTCDRATSVNCTNLTVVPNINFDGQFAVSVPYAQGLGTLGYRWNSGKYVDLVGTYFGNNNTYFRPAFVEWDGNVGYPLSKNATLLVTFRNITGIYDNAIQIFAPNQFSGAPTISGPPYVEFGEEYGPRTVLLTTQIHL